MSIEWILVIFFVFVTLLFVAIAALFPEWVGITGRKNQEYYERLEADGAAAQTDSTAPQPSQDATAPSATNTTDKSEPRS